MIDLGILALSAAIALPCGYAGYLYDPNRKEKKRLYKYWSTQCSHLKIYDDEKNIPLLQNLEKTNYGFRARIELPYGISLEKFEKAKEILEDKLPGLIELKKEQFDKYIYIKFITEKPEFEFKPVKCDNDHLWIANKPNGKPHFLSLSEEGHLMIGGKPGTGKSFLLAQILVNLIYNNHKFIEIYLIQIKKGDLNCFKNCKGVKEVVKSLERTFQVLTSLAKEEDRRNRLFEAHGSIKNIKEWNKLYPGKKLKRIFIAIEEVSFFIASDGDKNEDLKNNIWGAVEGLCKSARNVGIHVFMVTQRGSKKNVSPEAKTHMERIALRTKSDIDSEMIIGTKEARKLPPRHLILDGVSYTRLIACNMDEEFRCLQKYIPEICIPSQFRKEEISLNNKNRNLNQEEKHERLTPSRDEFERMLAIAKANKSISKDKKVIPLSVKEEEQTFKLSPKEKIIYNFIDKYGAITISQASKIFYRNCEKSDVAYKSASKALRSILKKGAIKEEINKQLKEKMYFIKRGKSEHDINIINAYIEILELGADILEFKTEHHLLEGKLRPDGFIAFKLNSKQYKAYIECDMSHYTNQDKMRLYEKLEGNFFIIIGKKDEVMCNSKKIKIIHCNENFEDLKDKLLLGQAVKFAAI